MNRKTSKWIGHCAACSLSVYAYNGTEWGGQIMHNKCHAANGVA